MKLALPAMLLLLAATAPAGDAFDRAVTALNAGSDATIGRDVTRLRRAGADLRASGATPLAGEEDVSDRWGDRRRSRGGAVSPVPYRDRILGPGYRSITLERAGIWRVEQTFLAGQRARVAIATAAAKPFTMEIRNDDREAICRASPAHRQCDWVPAYTARYSIEVRNPGPLAGRYFIVMQ